MNRSDLTMEQYSSALGQVLRTPIEVRASREARIHNISYFESEKVDALGTVGDPARIRNSATRSDALFVMYLRRGDCLLNHSMGSTRLHEGSFAIFHGSHAVEVIQRLPYELVGLRFQENFLGDLLPEWDSYEFEPLRATCSEGRALFAIARELLSTGPTLQQRSVDSVGTTLLTLLHQALCSLGAAPGIPRSNQELQLRRIKQFCHRNLGDPELGIELVGRKLGLSRAQLHKIFKHQGITLMAWVQEQRLLECRRAIDEASSARQLSEIALLNGFKSSSHFSRAFRKRFGVSPIERRRLARQILPE